MAWNAYCKTCGELRSLNDSGECTNCQVNSEKMLHNLREFSVPQETIIKYLKQESDDEKGNQ